MKLIILISLVVLSSGCYAEERVVYQNNGEKSHLYAYNKQYIIKYLSKSGYFDFHPDEVLRNSTGTRLYFYNYYSGQNASTILSVSAEGEIKKIQPPAKFSYLNDQEEFVAWFADIKQGIQFKNGKILHTPMLGKVFSSFAVDPSGKYFFVKTKSQLIEIASTDRPDKVLFYSKVEAEKIFLKDSQLYLFSRNYRNIKGPGDYEQHEIICQVLKKNNSILELIEEIHIPRPKARNSPFAVVDFDPWSKNVLLVDVRDMPFSFLTSWYIFDLKSKKMTKVGRARDYGFFLSKDILAR